MLRLKIDKYYTSLNGLLLLLWIEITKYSVSSGLENIANTVEWIKTQHYKSKASYHAWQSGATVFFSERIKQDHKISKSKFFEQEENIYWLCLNNGTILIIIG